jgi:hypothetical protein
VIEPDGYCREIESYLCKKNDGHLIRIVGPAFEQVSAWAHEGIPIKVACAGIDRYFERYYRKGPRRRPVRVEFCEADVRDAYDAWRRAVGVHQLNSPESAPLDEGATARRSSLATHLERVMARLTALRSSAQLSGSLDLELERVARRLDTLQPEAKGARGEARERLLEQLEEMDRELGACARDALDEVTRQAIELEAREAVAPFRDRMAPDAYQRACAAAVERSVRQHFGLPTVRFE